MRNLGGTLDPGDLMTEDLSMTTTQNAEAAREARIAAMRARRSERPTWTTIETTVGNIQNGDFLVVIPTQEGIRGFRPESAIEVHPERRYDVYHYGAGRYARPVESVTFAGGDIYPAHFRCTIRRQVGA